MFTETVSCVNSASYAGMGTEKRKICDSLTVPSKTTTPRQKRAARAANLTLAQVAVSLGCSESRVKQLVSETKLHPVNLGNGPGGGLVFARSDVARHKRSTCELDVAQQLEQGRHPLDVYFEADGRYSMDDVQAAMTKWARLTGCWVIEAPRGSYARWLERMGLTSITPRQLRRLIEALLGDATVGNRARSYLADQRAHNGQGEAKANERKERGRMGRKAIVALELEQVAG